MNFTIRSPCPLAVGIPAAASVKAVFRTGGGNFTMRAPIAATSTATQTNFVSASATIRCVGIQTILIPAA